MKCKCPICKESFELGGDPCRGLAPVKSIVECENAHCRCPHCQSLLWVSNGVLLDYYKEWGYEDPALLGEPGGLGTRRLRN